jgi:pimeloyl-ACP methyl ester carboxylesterase
MMLVYIHGNNATARSFNFIQERLAGQPSIKLEYDSGRGFYRNLARMQEELAGVDDIFFVAHSLGGIYALHLANALDGNVLGGVTMSTPYGGSEVAALVQFVLPFSRVIQEIRPGSAPIREANRIAIRWPWTNIVTIRGHTPLMPSRNDGVVTLDSMRFRDDMQLIELPVGHFEVLLSDEAVAVIAAELERARAAPRQEVLPAPAQRRSGS